MARPREAMAARSRRGSPTLAIVAREAGVSVPTVSKVLNRRRDVAIETRRRVEEALERMRYVPPVRQPPEGVQLLDVVLPFLDTAWATAILAGIDAEARRSGMAIVLTTMRPGDQGSWVDSLGQRRSRGVILPIGELTPGDRAALDRLRIPYVVLDPPQALSEDVPSVGVTNWSGGRSAARHLIGLGHERIAILNGKPDRMFCKARLDGYRSAMSDAGLPVPDEYIRWGAFDVARSYQQTKELLALPEPPTAIFSCTDGMALGVYDALHEAGVRIPDQMSVVGFDDLPESRWMDPHLTTVRQPLEEMAVVATQLIIRMIRGEVVRPKRIELSTTLVTRASTAPPTA